MKLSFSARPIRRHLQENDSCSSSGYMTIGVARG